MWAVGLSWLGKLWNTPLVRKLLLGGVLVLGLVIGIQAVLHQRDLLTKSREKIETLKQEIVDLEEAVALTDQLRKDNAILTRELTDLSEEIKNATSSSDPLPADILGIVRRVQRSGQPTDR